MPFWRNVQSPFIAIVAAGAILLAALNMRMGVGSFPPLGHSIAVSLGTDDHMISLVGIAPTIMFATSALLTSFLVLRISLRKLVILSFVVASIGSIGRVFVHSESLFILFTLVLMAGIGICNAILPALVKEFFPRHIAGMSAAYLVCMQVGWAAVSLSVVPLMNLYDWRVSLGLWAIPAVLTVVAWVWLDVLVSLRKPPTVQTANSIDQAENTHPGIVINDDTAQGRKTAAQYKYIWRNPTTWGVVIVLGITSTISYSFITWLPSVFVAAGESEQFGGAMGAVYAAAGIIPSFFIPWFAQKFTWGSKAISVAAFICLNIGILGIIFTPLTLPITWVLLSSLGVATFPLAMILINLRTMHVMATAYLSSRAQAVGYTLASFGPPIFGVLAEYTGSYTMSFVGILILNCVLLVGGFMAGRNIHVDVRPLEAQEIK